MFTVVSTIIADPMEKMKAVVYDKKGHPERLILREVDTPIPGDNEVLVKIAAASVNAGDYRSMNMGSIPKRRIFGADIAGTVESIGKGVRHLKPGDEVAGDLSACGFGGFAEYTTAPENALLRIPSGVAFEAAAAIPMAGTAALQALRDEAGIQEGQSVLIAGSGGGVGTFAVQLAKHFGTEVTAVCGPRNVELMHSLGADNVIDYTVEDFTRGSQRYDCIVAINGNRSLSGIMHSLKPRGILVVAGGALSQIMKSLAFGWLLSLGSKKLRTLVSKPKREDLAFLFALLENASITPVIDRRYTLDNTADAVRYVRGGHARGKVILHVKG
ncbi:MAG: NAD(P)-dependent alcohol dehydrogenase [Bacteroidia bacterium]|nr:NAD(P)-dependent alcohol dehydrogenase [Bacteroidia bacterium]